jgi:hypothetical protein
VHSLRAGPPQDAHVIRPPPRLERISEADVSIIVSRTQFRVVSRQALQREDRRFAGSSETGATGLEPATSGVTGQFGGHDRRRRDPTNTAICRGFLQQRSYDTAWLHGSPNRCLGHEWATKCCLPSKRMRVKLSARHLATAPYPSKSGEKSAGSAGVAARPSRRLKGSAGNERTHVVGLVVRRRSLTRP